MKKTLSKKQREARRRAWILARYIYPIVMVVLVAVSLCIPCMRYTTADTGTNETMSQWELMSNSWEHSRQYLFGSAEQTSSNTLFCRAVFGTLIGFFALFLVGSVAAVWSSVGAFCYFRDPDDRGTGSILYLTLFPNRVAVCLLVALILPMLTFPRLLVFFYERFFHYSVLMNVTFPEPLWIGGVLYLLFLVATVAFAKRERAMGMSPYPKKKPRGLPAEEQAEDTGSYQPQFSNESERVYYEMNQRAREEQAERIRRLLEKTERPSPQEDSEHTKTDRSRKEEHDT
ncbi:MAG: hypothetical protein IJY47_07140 [Clostridia bacterium]|nr:hypothetical protein [Clostridia bacterium]